MVLAEAQDGIQEVCAFLGHQATRTLSYTILFPGIIQPLGQKFNEPRSRDHRPYQQRPRIRCRVVVAGRLDPNRLVVGKRKKSLRRLCHDLTPKVNFLVYFERSLAHVIHSRNKSLFG